MVGAVASELPTVLTTAELCERWRCTSRTLERMARDGRIRRMKLRGGVRYPVDEVLRIERGEDRTAPEAAPDHDEPVRLVPRPDGPVLVAMAPAERLRRDVADAPTRLPTLDGSPAATTGGRRANPEPHTVPTLPNVPTAAGARSRGTQADRAAAERADVRPYLPQFTERTWYTICVAHRKGGVAKSTTTWFLARELARAGKRVVLRDLDPQQGLRDILRDHGCEDGRYSKNIALVPDGEPLPFTPDVELIDTPPALDDSLPGVARADVVIVPAMPEHQAVRALERMLLVLEQTRHEHPFTRVLGLLPVRVKPRWTEHAAFLQQIEQLGARFGHPVLPSIPESRAVLTYSLRGRLWRPVAEAVLADLERRQLAAAPVAGG
jgi:excisionase family DNA binding protein